MGSRSGTARPPTLLITAGQLADGTWNLFAIDKKTGQRVGAVPIPGETGYGMSSSVPAARLSPKAF